MRLQEAFTRYHPKIYSGVIFFGIGIALYFSLPFEPRVSVLGLASLFAFAVYNLCNRKNIRTSGWVLALCLVLLGLFRAAWHTQAEVQPKLPKYERSYSVTGWVEAIERSGTSERVLLRVREVSRLTPEQTPYRVRIRLTSKAVAPKVGDFVQLRAALKAPPGPVIPGGYDPARRAYFDQIGGFGFSYGPPEILPEFELGPLDKLQRGIVMWRYGLAARIMAKAPEQTAGLQTALITGVRRHIKPQQTEDLRVAGLAHILAISGLHMGLLSGGVFAAVIFLLACIPPLARRYDVRKPAAVIGVLAATAYLVLSGGSVATQRAYVMAVIVFLAVILDRRAISLRSVALAAIVTLALHPESLASVGFQMSFAAVTALVVTYQAWREWRPVFQKFDLRRRTVNFFTSLTVTSLVAGLATAGFAMFHFNRVARYGLLGNILAMPIFSLAVMPLAVVSLVAMPFGLEEVPLWLMGWFIEHILQISGYVSGLSGALFYVPSAPLFVLPLFTAGFIAMCLLKHKARWAGVFIMGVSLLIWVRSDQADIRISDKGQVAFWQLNPTQNGRADGDVSKLQNMLVTDKSRGDRYGREQFIQMSGRVGTDWIKLQDSGAMCDPLACRAEIKGHKISILQHPSEVAQECDFADIVILSVRSAGPTDRRVCDAELIDARRLAEAGAISIYLGADKIRITSSRQRSRNRPWS